MSVQNVGPARIKEPGGWSIPEKYVKISEGAMLELGVAVTWRAMGTLSGSTHAPSVGVSLRRKLGFA